MRIWSDSFEHRGRLPAEFAMGTADGFGANRNPHLAWDGAPEGTRSYVLLCIDTDAPTDASLAGREDVEIPVAQPRGEFVHWVLVDLPASTQRIDAGSCSDGVRKGGKQAPAGPEGTRQGLNDYTGWFAGDAQMGGDYYGYDGPCPPWNDEIPHRYVFTLYALDVPRLAVPDRFTGADARNAMDGHILASASVTGRYTLNPKVKP